MPRPRAGYSINGESVVGVTTVSAQLDWGKSGRLMAWVAKEVRTGKDPFKSRDRAADAGTVAHALIEAHLLDKKPDLSGYDKEVIDKGDTAFLNFLTWCEAYQLKPRSIEEPMVSPKLRCGTTPDLIAFIKDRLSIVDYKTGGAYESSYIELAARKAIWEELHPDEPITGGFHILKVNRDNGAFDHIYRESLDGCLEAFLCLLELYELKSKIKKYL